MFSQTHRGTVATVALAASLLAATMAWAEAPAPASQPADPGDAAATAPPTVWRSALSRFRPGSDVTARDWREANDEVTRIGGWRTYLREANAPAPAAAPATAPQTAPAPAADAKDGKSTPAQSPRGHGHHGHHGAPAGRQP